MHRDASQKQVIEKFSFIYTLTLSNESDRDLENTETDRDTLNIDFADRLGKAISEKITNYASDCEEIEGIKSANSQLATTKASSLAESPSFTTTIAPQWYKNPSYNSESLKLSEIIIFSEIENSTENHLQKSKNYLGKVLFVFACGYLAVAGWWLFGDKSSSFLAKLQGKEQIVISQADAEFIDYMERSLSTIDRQLQTSQKEEENEAAETEDIVYVPVYTPAPKIPQVATLPTNSIVRESPIATSPPPPPSPVKIPAPPPLPEPTPLPKSEPAEAVEKPIVAAVKAPAIKHTLLGIIDLGDKSAALFKVNKRTERIWLGQEIDSSGWVLDSVSDREAKISFQGKVRSIRVGETF